MKANDDLLAIGTIVRVKNDVGVVMKAEYVDAQPSGTVPLHTISFTHSVKKVANKEKLVPIRKKYVKGVNYSFVFVASKAIAAQYR